jgi:hypothetical protein
VFKTKCLNSSADLEEDGSSAGAEFSNGVIAISVSNEALASGASTSHSHRKEPMAYLITHFYKDGTAEQYKAVVQAVHPLGALPAGQVYHAAGPTDGGRLIAAIWDSKSTFDQFLKETLIPTLPKVTGGFANPPKERTAEIANLQTT